MFRSKSIFNRAVQAFAAALLLALMFSAVLGSTRVYAAGAASPSGAATCPVGTQAGDDYLQQEQIILNLATQSTRDVERLASLSGSTACPAGTQASDYYQRQEQAVLNIATRGIWNPAEITTLNIPASTTQATQ